MSHQAHFLSDLQQSLLAIPLWIPQPRQMVLVICSNFLDNTTHHTSSPGGWTACPEFFFRSNLPDRLVVPHWLIHLWIVHSCSSSCNPLNSSNIVTKLSQETRETIYRSAELYPSGTPELSKRLQAAPHIIQKMKTLWPKGAAGSTEGLHKRKKNPKQLIEYTRVSFWSQCMLFTTKISEYKNPKVSFKYISSSHWHIQ